LPMNLRHVAKFQENQYRDGRESVWKKLDIKYNYCHPLLQQLIYNITSTQLPINSILATYTAADELNNSR